jgi:hypothetical protein
MNVRYSTKLKKSFVFISVPTPVLEEPWVDFELNCTLIKIAEEITPAVLIKMRYLLRGSYLC